MKGYVTNAHEAVCTICGESCYPKGEREESAFGSCETWESDCCNAPMTDSDGEVFIADISEFEDY